MSRPDIGVALRGAAQNAKANGRWWEPPWWRLPDALPGDVTVEEFEAAVERVRRDFNDAWLLGVVRDDQQHPLISCFCNRGTIAVIVSRLLWKLPSGCLRRGVLRCLPGSRSCLLGLLCASFSMVAA